MGLLARSRLLFIDANSNQLGQRTKSYTFHNFSECILAQKVYRIRFENHC